jgi:hypothetical protein
MKGRGSGDLGRGLAAGVFGELPRLAGGESIQGMRG